MSFLQAQLADRARATAAMQAEPRPRPPCRQKIRDNVRKLCASVPERHSFRFPRFDPTNVQTVTRNVRVPQRQCPDSAMVTRDANRNGTGFVNIGINSEAKPDNPSQLFEWTRIHRERAP